LKVQVRVKRRHCPTGLAAVDVAGSIERSLRFALSRYGSLVTLASVDLESRGVMTECRLTVTLSPGVRFSIQGLDRDPETAAATAARRAASTLDRRISLFE